MAPQRHRNRHLGDEALAQEEELARLRRLGLSEDSLRRRAEVVRRRQALEERILEGRDDTGHFSAPPDAA